MRAAPAGHGAKTRLACTNSGPAARWIAPSTPPPPERALLAAFTITSTASFVMSPSTTDRRSRISHLWLGKTLQSGGHLRGLRPGLLAPLPVLFLHPHGGGPV